MEFIMENWYFILAGAVLLATGIIVTVRFFKQPSGEQVKKVKEWLLVACLSAERQFGSATGQLKLHSVYDLFLVRFPWLAQIVSFETFSGWVDESLETMEEWLKNDNIAEYVAGK